MAKLLAKIDHQIGEQSWKFDVLFDQPMQVIRGPTGGGKSLLLRILNGVIPSAKSHVELDARVFQTPQIRKIVPIWQRGFGWVPQNHLLFPNMTVRQNLLYAQNSEVEELNKLCDDFGIAALLERYPRNLSGGEAQRVALGRALLSGGQVAAVGRALLGPGFSDTQTSD